MEQMVQNQRPLTREFDVTVVIVSFNTCEVLCECLQSVYRESGSLRVQIIIVDNASTDGSATMIALKFPDVVLIRSEVNLGFGRANNLGFEAATGRYIVLLNSDAFPYARRIGAIRGAHGC